jgi:tetratricopeptide (TPR) repeat protein
VLQRQPKFAVDYLIRGMIHRALGQNSGAISDLNQAIALNADYAEAYLFRGSIRNELKEYNAALSDFGRVMALMPDPVAYYQRGLVYIKLGDRQLAIADFKKAMALYGQQGNSKVLPILKEQIRQLEQP